MYLVLDADDLEVVETSSNKPDTDKSVDSPGLFIFTESQVANMPTSIQIWLQLTT
jgi:hypothetical protein